MLIPHDSRCISKSVLLLPSAGSNLYMIPVHIQWKTGIASVPAKLMDPDLAVTPGQKEGHKRLTVESLPRVTNRFFVALQMIDHQHFTNQPLMLHFSRSGPQGEKHRKKRTCHENPHLNGGYTPMKTNMTGWKVSSFNRNYIFNWWFFDCHVCFPEVSNSFIRPYFLGGIGIGELWGSLDSH